MKLNRASLLLALLLGCAAPVIAAAQSKAADQSKAAAGQSSEYKLGDRLPQPKAPANPAGFKDLDWDALVPKNWDPAQLMKGLDLAQMSDGDPRAMEALDRMRKAWAEAPIEPSLNGARIRIPGFIVPLDTERGQVKEFLLVPYFGACIHSPPPPANQIIHGFAAKPLKDVQMMSAVWISGTVETARSETEFGSSGYRMKAETVAPYKQ
jgi:hypothetical protein